MSAEVKKPRHADNETMDTASIESEAERQVRKYLDSNTEGYRRFLENLLNHVKWAFVALVAAITVLFIFINIRTHTDVAQLATSQTTATVDSIVTKEFLEKRVEQTIVTQLDSRLKTAMEAADKRIAEEVNAKVGNAIEETASKNWSNVIAEKSREIAALRAEEIVLLPAGTIIAWDGVLREENGSPTGSKRDLPPGWRVCDGSAGTPDLRGVFLRGDVESGKIGGQDKQITGAVSEGTDLNKHKHQLPINNWAGVGGYSVGAPFGLGVLSPSNAHFVAIPANGQPFPGEYKLSDTAYGVDLNSHTHSVALVPRHYSVIFIMKVDMPKTNSQQMPSDGHSKPAAPRATGLAN